MYLYHIKRPGMSLEEGYIGVTSNTTRRFKEHYSEANRKSRDTRKRAWHLYNAIRKYPDLEFIVLEQGEEDYILSKERELRPLPNIGWNQAVGGSRNGGCIWKGQKRPEHSEKMKQVGFQKGNNLSPFKPIMAEGIIFESKKAASLALGVNAKTIYNRIKRGVEGYKWIEEEISESS